MIAYGCCVGSMDKLTAYVLPRIGMAPLAMIWGATSIAAAYNQILDACRWRLDDGDALILLHDDLEITDPHAETKLVAPLADPDVALVGVAGGGGESIYWWNHSPIGHQQTDVRLIDFGTRAGEVTLIEGSLMVLSAWTVDNLRFDEARFTGFHGYDEIGMQARVRGKKVVVVDVDTHHHNPEGYASPESAASCQAAAAAYQEKWRLG